MLCFWRIWLPFVTGVGVTHVLSFTCLGFFYRLRCFTFRIITYLFAASLFCFIKNQNNGHIKYLNIYFISSFRSFFYFLTLTVFNIWVYFSVLFHCISLLHTLFIVLYCYSRGDEAQNLCEKSDFISTDILGMTFGIKSQSGKTQVNLFSNCLYFLIV